MERQQYSHQPYAHQPYAQYNAPYPLVPPRARTVNDILPASIPGVLGGLQVVLWLAIIGLEAGGLWYDAWRGTAYAGFWCAVIYFDTWISMFCYLCCGKSKGCAIYLLVQNIINMIFSIVLMVITAGFVNNPCSCFSSALCITINWIDVTSGILGVFGLGCRAKLPILKGLLACSILMFLSSIAYIIAYIAISIWLCMKARSNIVHVEAAYQNNVDSVRIRQQQPDSLTRGYEYTGRPENHGPRSNLDHHLSPSKSAPRLEQDPYDEVHKTHI
ncbi:unnamed protein product [Adineta steineri]|uniref:Uncharacterized protein n=1 Tax=Adineta steineri TaxID=433720 RepID=A0A813VWJ9_9BILA|nr:unnamed protein product [Adineta steineri]